MAKATLATNFKDDILNSSMGNKRRYNLIQNDDGTVSLEDASTYDQVGSEYGAGQVNATNKAVNESADAGKIIDDVDDISAVTEEGYIAGALALKQVNNSLGGLKFGVDGDGNYGYYGADDSLIPFNLTDLANAQVVYAKCAGYNASGVLNSEYTATSKCKLLIVACAHHVNTPASSTFTGSTKITLGGEYITNILCDNLVVSATAAKLRYSIYIAELDTGQSIKIYSNVNSGNTTCVSTIMIAF